MRAMSGGKPASLRVYGFATDGAEMFAPAWLKGRTRRRKEDPARWPERLGRATRARPEGRVAWLHGVSVGESLSLLPLAERLDVERLDVTVLVTSGTVASAELLATRLPARAIHQYAPFDTPGATRRFLDHWRPELGVFVESELWPNLILGARARGVRLALVSAKLSERSGNGWRRLPGAARMVLGAFDLILARDAACAERLATLGARIDGLADLKFGAEALPVDDEALKLARRALEEASVLLAASTHPGEDEAILAAFAAARVDDRSRLIIAPRHPARGEAVERLALDVGLSVGRRTRGATLGAAAVHVADTVGELGLWYRLAALAVVGGSLAPGGVGGHNPLEPARLGCPFIAGPGVSAWPVYQALEDAGATRRVAPDDLGGWFARALAGDEALAAMAARAGTFVAAGDAAAGAATDQVMGLLR
jgi:3-deoxy-D-manno-octulosonic-acid transferase